MTDHARLAEHLLPFVLEAGAIEMRHYRAGVAVESKADESPVTAADREAEVVLLQGLGVAAPGIPVVAEESVADGRIPDIGARFFLVDPLDGTREFINKRDEFTVNVALVENGSPRFGIVYVPALGDLYVTLGAAQAGHAKIGATSPPRTLAECGFRDIRTRTPDPAALVAVASRSHLTPETETFLGRYRVASRRDAGSSLKFCLIARGDADIYPRLGPTMAWDTAAGHAVLAAAGGSVSELDGRPLLYGARVGEAAKDRLRNPHFVAWGASEPLPPAKA